MTKAISLSVIADRLNLQLAGDDKLINGLGLCNRETEFTSILSYVTNETFVNQVKNNKAITCLVVSNDFLNSYSPNSIGRTLSFIISDKPEVCFYTIHETLCEWGGFYDRYDFVPQIGANCNIDQTVVIENGVVIGNNVTIGPNSVIRAGSIIGDNTIIGCNTTIGSEGFQLITIDGHSPMHITHVGRCHICTNVYVGDNSCICNSLFGGETYIGDGVKIDNLVHVAHNLYIGKNAVITAHVILCGSSRIEEGAWIGPNSSILNRVVIGMKSRVGLGSVVTRDVAPYTTVYGNPAKVHEKH